MRRDVCRKLLIMKLGLSGSIVGLNENSSGFAVWYDTLEAGFKATSGPEDHNSADLARWLEAIVCAFLWSFDSDCFEVDVIHCSVFPVSSAQVLVKGCDLLFY